MGIQPTLPASWETCLQVKKQQLELDMEKQIGSKLGKEYVKAVQCHPAYLTYMQSISCKMLNWMKHKLGSLFQSGEISITSDMQMASHLWQKVKKKSLLLKVKEESEKIGLKTQYSENQDHGITSWQIDGETMEIVTDFILGLQNHCRWWLQPQN